MQKPKIRAAPEQGIQTGIMRYLRDRGWLVIKTHGNQFQSGLPDLYCVHPEHGQRWIEVKNPLHFSFTHAQTQVFPQLDSHGAGVWVLIGSSDTEYAKLFKPCNWWCFKTKKDAQLYLGM